MSNSSIITYGLVLIAFLITVGASAFINVTYKKYSKTKYKKGISGAEVARLLLKKHGLDDIYVVETKGYLTDHYDPIRKVIRLSSAIYNGESISSASVAAHECGHAIQDKDNYIFLKIRSKFIPVVNFSSSFGYIAIMIGLWTSMTDFLLIGIVLEIVILLFQLITLPVEIDASKRALKELEKNKILTKEELTKSKTVLIAAASTYIASVASSLLEILRLIIIYTRKNRD